MCILLLLWSLPLFSGQVWLQEGNKILGKNSIGSPLQGYSVCLSSTGNHLITAGPNDDMDTFPVGAVWTFYRPSRNENWSKQTKLTPPTPETQNPGFGVSIALSDDASTLAIGGYFSTPHGAIWVYSLKLDNTWEFQKKLVSNGITEEFGNSVAISSDGNLVAGGALNDDTARGAVYIFTRDQSTWSTTGIKLSLPANQPSEAFGTSVSLNNLGNILAVSSQSNMQGGVWVSIRAGLVWTSAAVFTQVAYSPGTKLYQKVLLNGKGDILVLTECNLDLTDPFVRIFQRQADNSWLQKGLKFSGGYYGGIGLSNSGNLLFVALSAPTPHSNFSASIYRRNTNNIWILDPEGNNINVTGALTTDVTINFFSVSDDEKEFALGRPYDNDHLGGTWLFRSYERQPKFQTYSNIRHGTLNGSNIVATYFQRQAQVSTHFFNNTIAYSYGIALRAVPTRVIRATGKILLTFKPALTRPFYLYMYRWPPGQYIFTTKFNIKSTTGQVKLTGNTIEIPTGNGTALSGILEFRAGISALQWTGKSKDSKKAIEYTLAVIDLIPN